MSEHKPPTAEDIKISRALRHSAKAEYKRGFIDALNCFAWWQDGVQYLGAGTTTLEDAIKFLDECPEVLAGYYKP